LDVAGLDLEGLGRVFIAAVIGAVLGWPARDQPGGLRTHALVCAGATLFSTAALHVVGPHAEGLLRVVQGVAGGIGFIGAATVLKRGGRIYGVSVAASIWIAGAAGCEIGLGKVVFAVLVAIIIAACNLGFAALERQYFAKHRRVTPASPASPEQGKDP
jgi:putative Mg2+ transporter-C (MgtC) family protein